jgi:hypothetical protein
MGYLNQLKALDSEKHAQPVLPKLPKPPFDSLDSTRSGHFQKLQPANDSEKHAPYEPPKLPKGATVPAQSCTTCAHVTRRGGCGRPIEAGLSDADGVIRYHPAGGKNCQAWASTHWLLHYAEREPMELWTDPPDTWAAVIARYPDAIAAEPLTEGKFYA